MSKSHQSHWMRNVLIAAGIYNLVWGAAVILFPAAIFDFAEMDLPRYPQIWQCIGMIVGVYGIGYLIAATNPLRHWPITLVGLLGKVFGPIGFAGALLSGELPLAFGATIVTNDLIWWVPFAAILCHAVQHNRSAVPVTPVRMENHCRTGLMTWQSRANLDTVQHVAIEVDDVATSLTWYRDKFRCETAFEDETWALLRFGNMSLALVTRGQHPPHIGFVTAAAASHGELKTHRDGTRSIYISDPAGNAVELLDPDSVEQPSEV